VSDLYVASTAHTTRNTTGGKPFTCAINTLSNWSVENVWITHTNTGFWMSGAVNGLVRGCRVRATYADGININRGSINNLVENNHVRGTGDDGIGLLSDTNTTTISQNNTAAFNTVIANWWGSNIDLAGGSGHVVSDNYLADNAGLSCFCLNLPGGFSMYAETSGTICRNTIVRGGGNTYGQKRGAIWTYPGSVPISGVIIRDNLITNSIFRGIHLTATTSSTQSQQITFQRNRVVSPGDIGIYIEGEVVGSGEFDNNTVSNPAPGFAAYTNGSKNFTATLSGNSWQ
jgi:hypothetical protein